MRNAFVLCLLFSGCTVVDDFGKFRFADGGGGAGGGGGSPGGDLGGRPGDLGPGACTTAGERLCVDVHHSGHCDQSLGLLADRDCPPDSMCLGGYCQPNVSAATCARQGDCALGRVCDLFVVSGKLTGFCSLAGGSGPVYTACTATNQTATCESGLCSTGTILGVHECLTPCTGLSGGDCTNGGICETLVDPVTIEGVSTTGLHGCFK
jgi:hypothetical protein